MNSPLAHYRVAIRYKREAQQYRILELSAEDLRDALAQTVKRFPEELTELADLVEIRRTNPASD